MKRRPGSSYFQGRLRSNHQKTRKITDWTSPLAPTRLFSGIIFRFTTQTCRERCTRTLMAYELEDPFAALISSSARHSAIDLTLRKAESRVYMQKTMRGGPAQTTTCNNTYTDSKEGDGLVDSAERGNINGLTTDSTLRTDTC